MASSQNTQSKLVEIWQKPIVEVMDLLNELNLQPDMNNEVNNYLLLTFFYDGVDLLNNVEHTIVNDPKFTETMELTENFYADQRLSIGLDLLGVNVSSLMLPEYHKNRAFSPLRTHRRGDAKEFEDFGYNPVRNETNEYHHP